MSLSIIPIIAAVSYYFMIRNPSNTEKYRYADWTITTPLMLFGVLQAHNVPLTTTLALLLTTVLMIGSAVLSLSGNANFWFIIGCLLFLPILYYIFHLKINKPAIYLISLLWSIYPIVWMLDKDDILTGAQASNVFSLLDVLAKIGLLDLLM